MRYFLPAITLLCMSFFIPGNTGLAPQVWNLELIIFDSDTIFRRGFPEYTHNYHYKLSTWMKSKDDSLIVLEKSNKVHEEDKSMKVEFVTDSTFMMTKIRSGGKIYPSVMDSGTYVLKHDTIFMKNKTRKSETMLVISEKKDKLFLNDGGTRHTVYMEYKKEIK